MCLKNRYFEEQIHWVPLETLLVPTYTFFSGIFKDNGWKKFNVVLENFKKTCQEMVQFLETIGFYLGVAAETTPNTWNFRRDKVIILAGWRVVFCSDGLLFLLGYKGKVRRLSSKTLGWTFFLWSTQYNSQMNEKSWPFLWLFSKSTTELNN